jgi:putative ABC transport system substrate-binding protein
VVFHALQARSRIHDFRMRTGVTVLQVLQLGFEQLPLAFLPQLARMKADALIVRSDPLFVANRDQIANLALKHALPTMAEGRGFVSAGCLMSYAPNSAAFGRGSAILVDKILKGANPGDLPIEQPTKFELAINLKTAKALGITIPQSLLLRADEVIQ